MIYVLREKPTSEQLADILREYETMIKIVVDIRRRVLAGCGEMHSDCESVLLEDGSEQEIVFESLSNIRPRLGNRSILIQNEELRQQVGAVTTEILGGAQ